MLRKFINLDANESIFFERELEHVKARSYDVKYPEFKATMLIPVSTEAGPGAESITYEQYDQVGLMKIISNYATDLPRADVKGKQFTSPVRSLGGSYGYNVQEVRNAQMTGKPLEQRRANAARKAYDQAVNRVAWFARPANAEDYGLTGLLYNPNITVAQVASGVGGDTWALKTAAEILKDLNDIVVQIVNTTKGVEVPDTILLPVVQYSLIATTRLDSGTDTTILQFFLNNNPSITRVEWVTELAGLTPRPSGLAGAKDVMVCYKRDPDHLTLELPQMYEQFPVQERGLEFVVPTHARIGGVLVYYPISVRLIEGI